MSDSLDEAIKNLGGFVRKGARSKKEFIPTGHFELDFAIRYGMLPTDLDLNRVKGYDPSKPLGLPIGRIVEVFGPEGGGKSSLCYRVAGYAQRMINKDTNENNLVAWIDTEHSFEEELAELNGVDVDSLLYSELYDEENPDKNFYAEDVMDQLCDMCKSGIKVIVVDSVANLVPKTMFENSAEKETIAKLARVLSQNLGTVSHYASKYKVLIIFINQVREKPGIMFGNPETTPGGRALKYNASVRLRIAQSSKVESLIFVDDEETKSGKKIIGRNGTVSIKKNRVGPPLLDPENGKSISVKTPVYYQPYFPDIEERMFDIGRQYKIISVRKSVFKWGDIKVEGKGNFIKYIKDNNLTNKLLLALEEKASENNSILPPEIVNFKSSDTSKEDTKKQETKKEDVKNEEVSKKVRRGRPKKDS